MQGGPRRQEKLTVACKRTPVEYSDSVPFSTLSIIEYVRHYPNKVDLKKRAIQ